MSPRLPAFDGFLYALSIGDERSEFASNTLKLLLQVFQGKGGKMVHPTTSGPRLPDGDESRGRKQ